MWVKFNIFFLIYINMFENPILFAMLVSSVVALAYYLFNRDRDKKNKIDNPNMKYVLVFGIVFIVSLIGNIMYKDNFKDIQETIKETVDESVPDVSLDGGDINVGDQPPF